MLTYPDGVCCLCKERKQREFDELNSRTDALMEDNANLQRLLDSRNLEIARLHRQISGLTRGSPPGNHAPGGGHGSNSRGVPSGQSLQQQRGESISLGAAASQPPAAAGWAAAAQRPQLNLTASRAGSVPGFVEGVDGQYLRLRPGHMLPGMTLPMEVDQGSVHQAVHGPERESRSTGSGRAEEQGQGQGLWHSDGALESP
jgi:hypothetical protein